MNWKPTIIVFVLALLSVIAFWLTGGAGDGAAATRARDQIRPLLTAEALPIDQVDRITLARRDQPGIEMARDAEGQWMQQSPFPFPLDTLAIRELVLAALQVEVTGRLRSADLRNGLDAAALSLDPPEAVITYGWADRSLTIALGRRGVAGRAYLMLDDRDEIYVVSHQLHQQAIEMDPKEWRDRAVFRGVGIQASRVIREIGTTRVVIEQDRRQWRMTEPVQTRVDPARRDEMVQVLAAARSRGFIADDPRDLTRFSLDPPVASIEIHLDEDSHDSRQRLLIGAQAGAGTQDRFGMIDGYPAVFRLPARVLQALFVHPADLADPTGSGAFSADVRTIEVRAADRVLRLQRDLEHWVAPDHGGRRVSAETAEQLLAMLTAERAPEVLLQEYPRELEVAIVTFRGFDDRPLDTVRVLFDPETGHWGLENGDNVLRIFGPDFALPLTPEAFGL